MASIERQRLAQGTVEDNPWRRWGPYVAERAWGTVREDYSPGGDCWNHLPHDLARSQAYRWGEDGLAGICDRYQAMVFALALWNGRDPILKERLFGLANPEGNHGEDVKEYYFYLDNVPTHSWMEWLYKYPQAAFPYRQLVEENRRRGCQDMEYELLDTGVFDQDRYFDVFVRYAKASPEDILIEIEAHNRGPDAAELHLLPHLWFRNTWSFDARQSERPRLRTGPRGPGHTSVKADQTPRVHGLKNDYHLEPRWLYAEDPGSWLFTENESNPARVPGARSAGRYFKDAFHRRLVQGEAGAVNPAAEGSRCCLVVKREIPARGSTVLRLRLAPQRLDDPFEGAREVFAARKREADEFYAELHPPRASADECRVQRQALSGLLWSKQFYLYDVASWMDGDDPARPPPESRRRGRNAHWRHLRSSAVMSMPDKWEYPWFAAWDLAFQSVPLALADPALAKEQLWLLLFEQFQHINGQIPAYEFEFSDLNPPVQAWAVWRVFHLERMHFARRDLAFLERCFHKLLLNFTWWVNRVDEQGNNLFEGGFLGMDNISVLDRSERLVGALLEQSDATGWMGLFCQNMMRIALELAKENPVYEALASKFFAHWCHIGAAMTQMGGREDGLWSEEDGFFYDMVRNADGSYRRIHLRSMVGLIPLYAVERLDEDWIEPFGDFHQNLHWFIRNRPDLMGSCVRTVYRQTDGAAVHVLSFLDEDQLRRVLSRVFDPAEFFGPHGLRSLSRYHRDHPYTFGDSAVRYTPAESSNRIKGGNSNWRGPVWFPTTFMLIEALRKLTRSYGPDFELELKGEAGGRASLDELARRLADRLISIFTRGADGRRPVYGATRKFQDDPHWRDHVLFFEYFNGDDGAGLGASHQTGWTALVATLIDEWRR